MGADIKSLRTRIKSVDSTLHLTKAMGLVASSKIRRATESMNKSRQYAAAFENTVRLLCACPECSKSPYMRAVPSEAPRTRLIVIAGDRGMAGGYNANVFRLVRDLTAMQEMDILPIGRRACDRFKADFVSSEHFSAEDASAMAVSLCADFAAGDFDRLGIVYTRWESMMSQTAEVGWILPLVRDPDTRPTGVIFEPDEMQILESAVPVYVAGRLYHAIRESFASEVTARRMAMDSAGKNAQEMINSLQLAYNRARQSAITQEITEIVAGAGSEV